MNNLFRINTIISFLICYIPAYGMQNDVERKLCDFAILGDALIAHRTEVVAEILAISPKYVDGYKVYVRDIFAQENLTTLKWFEKHKHALCPSVRAVAGDACIEIMGSRLWKTNHMLSDIDAVILTEAKDHESIIDALQQYYTQKYPYITQVRTKTQAGLYLFALKNFSDVGLGTIKLEYTIQTRQTQKMIYTLMQKKLSTQFTDEWARTRYAIDVMRATHNNNQEELAMLKAWMKFLPTTNKSNV